MFALTDLEELRVSDLRNLADYYGIDLPSRARKSEIINALVPYATEQEMEMEEDTPASVRIQRIRRSK